MTTIKRPSSGPGSKGSIGRHQSNSSGSSSDSGGSSSGGEGNYTNPALAYVKGDVRHTETPVITKVVSSRETKTDTSTSSGGGSRGYVAASVLQGRATPTDIRTAQAQIRQETARGDMVVRAEKPQYKRTPSVIPQSYAVSQAVAEAEKKGATQAGPTRAEAERRLKEQKRQRDIASSLMGGNIPESVRGKELPGPLREAVRMELEPNQTIAQGTPLLGPGKVKTGISLARRAPAAAEKTAELARKVYTGWKESNIIADLLGKAGPKAAKIAENKGLQFSTKFAQRVGEGYVVTEGVSKGSRAVESVLSPEDKPILSDLGFQRAVTAAQEQSQAEAYQTGIIKGLASEIPIIGASQNLQAFDIAVTKELENAGYTGERLEQARRLAFGERTGRSNAEFWGLLTISRGSEVVGRQGVIQAFKEAKPFSKNAVVSETFKKTFPKIARAGAVEGLSTEVVLSSARESEKPLLPSTIAGVLPEITMPSERKAQYEKDVTAAYEAAGYTGEELKKGVSQTMQEFNPGSMPTITTEARITDMLGLTAGGYLSAGILGSTIAASQVSKKASVKAAGKALEYGSYLIDPLEKPGDISQDVVEKYFQRVANVPIRTPVITETILPENVARFSVDIKKPPVKEKPGVVIPSVGLAPGTKTKGKADVSALTGDVIIPPTPPEVVLMPDRTPITIIPPTPPSSGPGGSKGGGGGGGIPSIPYTPIVVPPTPLTPVPTPTPTPVLVPAVVPTPSWPVSPRVPNLVPTITSTPVPQPEVGVPTTPFVPTDVFTPAEVPVLPEVPVPTYAFTPTTSINVPAFTPLMRVPPPILPQWPGAGRGAGIGKGKRLKYLSELQLSRELLGSLVDAPVRRAEKLHAKPLADFGLNQGFDFFGRNNKNLVQSGKQKKKRKKAFAPGLPRLF